ncbi:2OG-Fe(II) oxygenase [Paenibacillus flagellatus]|uniref:Prolyl 4-hydroxylase subunit alpha n=1 Tax=Paenibacillus flagellatus TaxID=2211139 RepID=A0A2V5KWA3_9BACL|nr:2OG-Fe(II) oxygenase [Paenibacillus flagellatus]PYI56567.1 prolyl 4-hydroxylase subunit alpha [Paenibacillus flagellatus]
MREQADERIASLDWPSIHRALDEQGFASIPELLTAEECRDVERLYGEEERFRATIDMARYRFGAGEYRYFQSPLPPLVQMLREAFYPELATAANRWLERLGEEPAYPAELGTFLEECRRSGQTRPTPLVLKYEAEGYNCLHQDVYGDVSFPFQVVVALNRKDEDYAGGEFVLVEQRPRAQSRAHVVALAQGEALVFPTRHRPVAGTRGYYRTTLRHGVATVRAGTRYTLGVIFHDAT